jgi:putative ABC transport system substrate-binding protein
VQRREFITVLGGAAVTWPLAAGAQPGAKPVIGILGPGSAQGYAEEMAAFRAGLGEAGFIEHQNVLLEYRWADDHLDRLAGLAADLVLRQVAVIVSAGGTGTALAAKAATTTIPIVFSLGGDPVKAGLVASLSRPGANITGVAAFSDLLITKRLELARDLVRPDAIIAFLLNPNNPNKEMRQRDIHDAASAIGREVRVLFVSAPEQFDAVFTTLAQEKVGAVIPGDEPLFNSNGRQLVASAARHAIPVIYQYRQFVVTGGLMSYGPKLEDNYHQAGIYAGRILKGDRPADLPVMRPSKFNLVINLTTAKSIGLDVPPALLARADEVIE